MGHILSVEPETLMSEFNRTKLISPLLEDAKRLLLEFFPDALLDLQKRHLGDNAHKSHTGVIAFRIGSARSELDMHYLRGSSTMDSRKCPDYNSSYRPITASQFLSALIEFQDQYDKVFSHDWRAASIYAHRSREAVIESAKAGRNGPLKEIVEPCVEPLQKFEQSFGLFMHKHGSELSVILTDAYAKWAQNGSPDTLRPLQPSELWIPEPVESQQNMLLNSENGASELSWKQRLLNRMHF